MRDYTAEAVALSQGKTRADLDRERVLALALIRLCEVISEAASKVPPELRERHPQIPWAQIVSFRNRLIHGYDDVDLDIVWQMLTGDLPAFRRVRPGP
jgi:uncharacterized protein with HEPN domain